MYSWSGVIIDITEMIHNTVNDVPLLYTGFIIVLELFGAPNLIISLEFLSQHIMK